MVASPREIVEQIRRMVAGDGIAFADLFAGDGLLEYPFAPPGQPHELVGRPKWRRLFQMDGVDAVVHETTDPEVVIAEIAHYGRSQVTGTPYRFEALGVIRVRDGEIVSYRDYMDPIALARLLGRTSDLASALAE